MSCDGFVIVIFLNQIQTNNQTNSSKLISQTWCLFFSSSNQQFVFLPRQISATKRICLKTTNTQVFSTKNYVALNSPSHWKICRSKITLLSNTITKNIFFSLLFVNFYFIIIFIQTKYISTFNNKKQSLYLGKHILRTINYM